MVFLGIIYLLFVPFLWGEIITFIFKERKSGSVIVYATGLLSLFAFFFVCLLAALKLDWSLYTLEKLFISFSSVVALLGGILLFRRIKSARQFLVAHRCNIHIFFFLVPAIFLFLYSYIYLAPSIVNDDTWDVVVTTIATGGIYTHSAMTGFELIKGFPIFYKIYITPMLISCISDFFHIAPKLVICYIFPAIVYILNLSLVYILARELRIKNIGAFMLIHMMILVAGTYLPMKGIPVTAGYAILREGYSGYAFVYGVVAPLVVLHLLRKRYLLAVSLVAPAFCLVRLDRVYYAIISPLNSITEINLAGKLFAMYFAAIAIMLFFFIRGREKHSLPLLILPSILIAYVGVKTSEYIELDRSRILYFLGLSFIIFSSGSFTIFSDAELSSEIRQKEKAAYEINALIDNEEAIVWSSPELMGYLRRDNGRVKTLYGRNIRNTSMDGLDYEDGIANLDMYYLGYMNLIDRKLFHDPETPIATLLSKAKDICDYVVVPVDNLNESLSMQFEEAEYRFVNQTSGYLIYRTK